MTPEEKKESLASRIQDESGSQSPKQFLVLIAEDDEDDFLLIEEAFKEANLPCSLSWVKDGEELLNYLTPFKEKDASKTASEPGLILLDLNMPKISGMEALQEIKSDAKLRKIPIVILTTSNSEHDVVQCYDKQGNSFIQKPIRFETLLDVVRSLGQYWFQTVKLP